MATSADPVGPVSPKHTTARSDSQHTETARGGGAPCGAQVCCGKPPDREGEGGADMEESSQHDISIPCATNNDGDSGEHMPQLYSIGPSNTPPSSVPSSSVICDTLSTSGASGSMGGLGSQGESVYTTPAACRRARPFWTANRGSGAGRSSEGSCRNVEGDGQTSQDGNAGRAANLDRLLLEACSCSYDALLDGNGRGEWQVCLPCVRGFW